MSTLVHFRHGAGPRPVLLLHGFLGSGRNLATVAKQLAARDPSLTVVVPDLTGHGASPPLPPDADLGTLAADVLATARALALPAPLRIIGHSLGGRVALRAALLAPAEIAHITLLDITPSPIPNSGTDSASASAVLAAAPAEAPSREAFRAHLRAGGLSDGIVEWLLLNLVHEAGVYRWRIDRAALAALHPRVNAADLWAAVEQPHRPYGLFCIRGARSPYVRDVDARRLEAAGCPVVTLPDAGHFVHVDQPKELLEELLRAGIDWNEGPKTGRSP